MSHNITSRKFAVILAGLVLTATASVGHAQQKWMEQVLEQSRQEQQLAGQSAEDQNKADETRKEADEEINAPKGVDISNTYDDEGNPIVG